MLRPAENHSLLEKQNATPIVASMDYVETVQALARLEVVENTWKS